VAIREFQDPGLLEPKSAHYIIAKREEDGIVQMVKDQDVAFHARGTIGMLPSWMKPVNRPFSRVNAWTIGIELEYGPGDSEGYTEFQYWALERLLRSKAAEYEVPLVRERVLGHGEIQSDRGDPRDFDWSRIGF
jgi:N-acetyl-anhydromuramyl-L-alanine amidase AmpD